MFRLLNLIKQLIGFFRQRSAGVSNPYGLDVSEKTKREFTMRLSVIDGILLILFLMTTGGPVGSAYAIRLGADNTLVGIFAALPLATQGLSFIAPWLAGLVGSRKWIAITTAFIGRILWGIAIFVPWLMPEPLRAVSFVILTGVASIFLAINTALWFDWIGRVIPCEKCVSYLSWRNGITVFAGTMLNITLSRWMDNLGMPTWSLQIVLSIGVIGSLLGALTLFFQYEPPNSVTKIKIKDTITETKSNFNVIRILLLTFASYFSITMLAPATSAYFIKDIGMNFTSIAIWSSITTVIGFFMAKYFGKVIDIANTKLVLHVSMWLLAIFLPISYILTKPNFIFPTYFGGIFEGIAALTVSSVLFRLILRNSTPKNQSIYVGLFMTAMGLGGACGAALFGPLFDYFSQFRFVFLGVDFNGYRLIFVFSAVLRLLTISILRSIDEPPNNFGLEPLTTRQTVLLLARESVDTFKQNAWSIKQTFEYILATVFKSRKSDLNE